MCSGRGEGGGGGAGEGGGGAGEGGEGEEDACLGGVGDVGRVDEAGAAVVSSSFK